MSKLTPPTADMIEDGIAGLHDILSHIRALPIEEQLEARNVNAYNDCLRTLLTLDKNTRESAGAFAKNIAKLDDDKFAAIAEDAEKWAERNYRGKDNLPKYKLGAPKKDKGGENV